MSKTKTQYFKELVDQKTADTTLEFLEKNVQWEDSIYSKRKARITRKGYNFTDNGDIIDDYVLQLVTETLKTIEDKIQCKYRLAGIYLNYYPNGESFLPSHSHIGQVQFVISLGATRKLTIGKTEYAVGHGDCVIFGSSAHSIPIEPEVKNSRISIATFLDKI